MSRRVSCPGCDATLKVAEEYVGRALVCSKCRTEFRLPPTADDASPSPRKKPDALSGGATRSQPPKPNPKPKEELRGPSVDRARRLREDHRKRGRRGNDTPVILGMEKTILVSSRLDYLSDEKIRSRTATGDRRHATKGTAVPVWTVYSFGGFAACLVLSLLIWFVFLRPQNQTPCDRPPSRRPRPVSQPVQTAMSQNQAESPRLGPQLWANSPAIGPLAQPRVLK